MRFGESLVEAGALNREQLAKALEMQKILGGRLGSNILELGLLDEGTLLDCLGRFRSTQTVDAMTLKRIPSAVLRSIPRKLALRYRLIPYQVRGKTLYVASKNPGDALQEDEISFLTSFMVRTHLALEFHLEVALHRHFKSPLDQRFVALTRRFATGPGSPSAVSPLPSTPAGARPSSPPGARSPSLPSSGGARSALPVSQIRSLPTESSAQSEVPAHSKFRNLNTPEPSMEFIELDADDLALLRGSEGATAAEVADVAPGQVAAGQVVAAGQAPPAFGPGIGEQPPQEPAANLPPAAENLVAEGRAAEPLVETLDEAEDQFGMPEDADLETRLIWASRELQAADIRDEIGDVLLEFASAFYRRRALVIRRKEELVGWMASGEGPVEGLEESSIRELSMAGTAPSIFFGLQEPGSFWLGPLPLLPANRQLVEALKGPAPKDCLVLPISLRSKIVGYLYVDNLDAGVAGTPVAEMKRLVAKAGLAFEVYILKNKIRMV